MQSDNKKRLKQIELLRLLVNNLKHTHLENSSIVSNYEEINAMYSEVINNITSFYKKMEIEDITSIFAVYIYMYRKGYLSQNHNFEYNAVASKFSKTFSMGTVTGKGVSCHIVNMLSDIYNKMDFNSDSLLVQYIIPDISKNTSNYKNHNNIENLLPVELKKAIKRINLAEKSNELLHNIPLPNHLITEVSNGINTCVLDPTNDLYLHSRGINIFSPGYGDHSYMARNASIDKLIRLYGVLPTKKISSKDDQLPPILWNEYAENYEKTINKILDNISYFDEFYDENKKLYNDITNIAFDKKILIKNNIFKI